MSAGGGAAAAPAIARDDLVEGTSMGGTVPDDELAPWADDEDWFIADGTTRDSAGAGALN